MGQSLVQIYVHIKFSTKNRQPLLRTPELQQRTHAYLAGICNKQKCPALKVGGVEDHVHLLCRLDKTLGVSDLLRELKRDSSVWIQTLSPDLKDFYWQRGYGAFSVSPGHVDELIRYIENQAEHHKQETFQDEFRRICRKYGAEIDESYVWD